MVFIDIWAYKYAKFFIQAHSCLRKLLIDLCKGIVLKKIASLKKAQHTARNNICKKMYRTYIQRSIEQLDRVYLEKQSPCCSK